MPATTRPYVSVIPGDPGRNDPGWLACYRNGDVIHRDRLSASGRDADGARAEAQRRYPDRLVVMPGEPYPTAGTPAPVPMRSTR